MATKLRRQIPSRPIAVKVSIVAVALFTLAGLSGCGQSQTHPAALGPLPTRTPSAAQRTITAQQTTIAQLRSALATPTLTPIPVATDTPILEPTDTATPVPNTIGPWQVEPVAVDELRDQTGYKSITLTLSIRNISSDMAIAESRYPNEDVAVQVRTSAGYLYPQTSDVFDENAVKFGMGHIPPGFAVPVVVVVPQVPANATVSDVVATGGDAWGKASVSLPLTSVPPVLSHHLSWRPAPASGYSYLRVGDAIKQGPLTFRLVSARLRPYCTLDTYNGTSVRWVLSVTTEVDNAYGYALHVDSGTLRAFYGNAQDTDQFGPAVEGIDDPAGAGPGGGTLSIPFHVMGGASDILPGQSATQDMMAGITTPEQISKGVGGVATGPDGAGTACAHAFPSAKPSTSYKLLVELPPIDYKETQAVSGDTVVAPEKWAVYDLKSLTTGPLYVAQIN